MKRIAPVMAWALCLAPACPAVEVLHWDRLPLPVHLVVGQERVIILDRRVRVGVPNSRAKQLRVQSAGGAAYLRASAPFATSRVQLQDIDTGALILLDVSAEAASADLSPLEPIRIVEESASVDAGTRASGIRSPTSDENGTPTPIPVVLTRYAAQALYAPLRTLEPISGLTQVPLPHDLALETLLIPLPVRAKALAAWRLADHWVTAIQLTHTSPGWLAMDPRALQGDFLAATFQHRELGPAGDSTDTTVVYLVTRDHGLREALFPAVSAADASVNRPTPKPALDENSHEE